MKCLLLKGFLTDSGLVNPERVQLIMQDLGEMEDGIFKERQGRELQFRARDKAKKRRNQGYQNKAPKWQPGGVCAPQPLMGINHRATNVRQEAADMRVAGMSSAGGFSQNNSVHNQLGKMDNAEALKSMLVNGDGAQAQQGTKRGHEQVYKSDLNSKNKTHVSFVTKGNFSSK